MRRLTVCEVDNDVSISRPGLLIQPELQARHLGAVTLPKVTVRIRVKSTAGKPFTSVTMETDTGSICSQTMIASVFLTSYNHNGNSGIVAQPFISLSAWV